MMIESQTRERIDAIDKQMGSSATPSPKSYIKNPATHTHETRLRAHYGKAEWIGAWGPRCVCMCADVCGAM
jgi:hypothetical protein